MKVFSYITSVRFLHRFPCLPNYLCWLCVSAFAGHVSLTAQFTPAKRIAQYGKLLHTIEKVIAHGGTLLQFTQSGRNCREGYCTQKKKIARHRTNSRQCEPDNATQYAVRLTH